MGVKDVGMTPPVIINILDINLISINQYHIIQTTHTNILYNHPLIFMKTINIELKIPDNHHHQFLQHQHEYLNEKRIKKLILKILSIKKMMKKMILKKVNILKMI